MARPVRRNKKVVDYAQFGDAADDDEDFANVAAPSNKKSKKVHTDLKKETKETQKQPSPKEIQLQKRGSNKRIALDDKLYQRDLEVALALSVNDPSVGKRKMQDSHQQEKDDETCTAKEKRERILSDCNEILAFEDSAKQHDTAGRDGSLRTAIPKAGVQTEDQDSAGDTEPESVSTSTSLDPIRKSFKTSSPTAVKKPRWTPPAASGSRRNSVGGILVKSPTQVLRLGLSRLARVKPLHPGFGNS